MTTVDLVRPCAASAQETKGLIRSTAHRPTELHASSVSWQKINKPPAPNVSTCSEAEPIYATSSRACFKSPLSRSSGFSSGE
jgi:hypothetical protein